MFAKIFALVAVLAVAFAAPAPEPKPQLVSYTSGLDYYGGGAVVPSVYSAYGNPGLAYGAVPVGVSAPVYFR